MDDKNRQKWNSIVDAEGHDKSQAAQILTQNLHLLPQSGIALDLACGLGGNALLLAESGLNTHAWDISDVAISKLHSRAKIAGLDLYTQQRDIIHNPPDADSFDLILVSHFLERSIIPCIIKALKKNGLIFYQTFTREKLDETGPTNPEFLLERNELLKLFADLIILFYKEEHNVGNLAHGNRNEAMLIAQKL